jgi:aminoglycoside phosphotransferase (APT) family kinase protein
MDARLRGFGVRLGWHELPARVRHDLDLLVGAPIVHAEDQAGGFSPGVAARVVLDDGRRLFVKAVGEELNALAPELYRQEASVARLLPRAVPAPRLEATYDEAGWVALVFEDVEGRAPALPWEDADLERVVAAVEALSATLSPSPVPAPTLAEHADGFAGFSRLRAEDDHAALDPWIARHLDRLCEAHEAWPNATRGDTLLHLDIRADNILLTEDAVVFVDWPHARVGAPWIDLLYMLPSVAMQGGRSPAELFAQSSLANTARDEDVTVALAGFAGLMIDRGRLPDPPGLPTLRHFQRAQAGHAVRWLRERTGWR